MLRDKIGFVGFGISNYKLLRALKERALFSDFFVSDSGTIGPQEKEFLSGAKIEFEENGHTEKLLSCDSFVVSPGISPFSDVGKAVVDSGKFFTTELEVSLDILRSRSHGTVVGITGTNGKSTTVTMLSHILSSKNKRVFQGGNLGDPLAGALGENFEFYVLEVSSFQLKWFAKESERFHLSAIINLGEDHLDYHRNLEDYFNSKLRLIQMTQGFCVLPESVHKIYAPPCNSFKALPFSMTGNGEYSFDGNHFKIVEESFTSDELPYGGLHNYEDTLVAMILSKLMGLELRDVFEDLKSYSFLLHRLQLIGELRGVKYYDDSKATNAHAVSAALKNFSPEKTIIIIGGKEKDESYGELIEQLKTLKHVVVLGKSMKSLTEKVRNAGIIYTWASSMEEAVAVCNGIARTGDSVVLSPAGSSFDLYKNYKERGDHFKKVVNSLEKTKT